MPSTANIQEVRPVALVIIGSAERYKEYSQIKPADLEGGRDNEINTEEQRVRGVKSKRGGQREKKEEERKRKRKKESEGENMGEGY